MRPEPSASPAARLRPHAPRGGGARQEHEASLAHPAGTQAENGTVRPLLCGACAGACVLRNGCFLLLSCGWFWKRIPRGAPWRPAASSGPAAPATWLRAAAGPPVVVPRAARRAQRRHATTTAEARSSQAGRAHRHRPPPMRAAAAGGGARPRSLGGSRARTRHCMQPLNEQLVVAAAGSSSRQPPTQAAAERRPSSGNSAPCSQRPGPLNFQQRSVPAPHPYRLKMSMKLFAGISSTSTRDRPAACAIAVTSATSR